jgi:hypothetical protein
MRQRGVSLPPLKKGGPRGDIRGFAADKPASPEVRPRMGENPRRAGTARRSAASPRSWGRLRGEADRASASVLAGAK